MCPVAVAAAAVVLAGVAAAVVSAAGVATARGAQCVATCRALLLRLTVDDALRHPWIVYEGSDAPQARSDVCIGT
jgi:hypothetical protein